MTEQSWLVDGSRIASKIRSASSSGRPERLKWKSNPTKTCPNCNHVIDNRDVAHEWPGLPKGVKFDPTDQEIIWHLLAKSELEGLKPHPFIVDFIPTVDEDDGICYTHPQNLPGVKQDGSVMHFFHRSIKAYSTGTRKRRKINGDDDSCEVRWHKTGKTKPVMLGGLQKGCKKIMVLYMSTVKGGKSEKSNWVMHQYHVGIEDDEKDGDYVVSKIFYKIEPDILDSNDAIIPKSDPILPPSQTSDLLHTDMGPEFAPRQESASTCTDAFLQPVTERVEEARPLCENPKTEHVEEVQHLCESPGCESPSCQMVGSNDNDNLEGEDLKYLDSESQNLSQDLLNTQQLAEALSLCAEFLNSQSPNRDGNGDVTPGLSDYAELGGEHLKKDLEECQNLVEDPVNIELDPPSELGLSQLDFYSDDSFIPFGGSSKPI